MSEMKHTPGPWDVDYRGNYFEDIDVYPRRDGPPPIGRWAEICSVKDYEGDDEAKANARLIAAAPELLDVLKEIMDVLKREAPGTPLNNHRFDGLGVKAYAAIARAEGRA